MKIEIELNFNSDDFREIYFRDNQGNYFLSVATKQPFIVLLVMIPLEILAITVFPESGLFISVVSIGLVISLGFYLYAAFKLWKWKRQIREFLKKESAYSKYQLILTDNSFSLIQDKTEHIEKWTSIKSVDITPQYMSISGTQDYLIPLKSVGIEAYQKLKKIVSEKTK